jgi:hypothetical protein
VLKTIAMSGVIALAAAGSAPARDLSRVAPRSAAVTLGRLAAVLPASDRLQITDSGRALALRATTDQLGAVPISGWSTRGEQSTRRDSELWLSPKIVD